MTTKKKSKELLGELLARIEYCYQGHSEDTCTCEQCVLYEHEPENLDDICQAAHEYLQEVL